MQPGWLLDPRYDAGLDRLADLQRREAALFVERAQVLAQLAARTSREGWQGHAPFESLLLDVAGTCVLGQVAASSRLLDAEHLVVRLPQVAAALQEGLLAVHQACVVVAETRELAPGVCAEVERRVLPLAPALCPADLRRLVRRTVLEVDADEQARREQNARRRRRVWVKPVEDGMALLCALLPAEQAQRAFAGLTERARAAGREPGEGRCADELRADLLTDSLAAAPAGAARPVQVVVHVSAGAALGRSEAPGDLSGHGPISAAHARRLLPGAELWRASVDPVTGEVSALDRFPMPARPAAPGPAAPRPTAPRPAAPMPAATTAGTLAQDGPGRPRTGPRDTVPTTEGLQALLEAPPPAPRPPEQRHDPSAQLARLVRWRDQRCDGIGCSVPATRCELDHVVPWPSGQTSAANLRARSQRCHHAKHAGWSVSDGADGRWWTSPAGRRYWVPRRSG